MLLLGAPRGLDFDSVKEALLTVSGVRAVHDLHVWALTLNHTLLSAHLAVGKHSIYWSLSLTKTLMTLATYYNCMLS